jgi:hypothetical protein
VIESLPSELLKVVRALPLVADRLDAIGSSTDELPKMRAGIDALGEDTRRIAGLQEAMERLAHWSRCSSTSRGCPRRSKCSTPASNDWWD